MGFDKKTQPDFRLCNYIILYFINEVLQTLALGRMFQLS